MICKTEAEKLEMNKKESLQEQVSGKMMFQSLVKVKLLMTFYFT